MSTTGTVVTKYRNTTRFETQEAASSDFMSSFFASIEPAQKKVHDALIASNNLSRVITFDVSTQVLTESVTFNPPGILVIMQGANVVGADNVGSWVKGE